MNTSPHSPTMYDPYIVQNELGFPMSSYSITTKGIRETKQLRLPYKLTCFVACINHYYLKSLAGLLASRN